MISKNPFILALQLLGVQLFIIFLQALIIKLVFGVTAWATLTFMPFVGINILLPPFLIGYFFTKKYKETISQQIRKKVALIASSTLISLLLLNSYLNPDKFLHKCCYILVVLTICGIYFMLFYFTDYYFLDIGSKFYLKRNR